MWQSLELSGDSEKQIALKRAVRAPHCCRRPTQRLGPLLPTPTPPHKIPSRPEFATVNLVDSPV
jgi:hypothetical protein